MGPEENQQEKKKLHPQLCYKTTKQIRAINLGVLHGAETISRTWHGSW
jgi:hypothetical protein